MDSLQQPPLGLHIQSAGRVVKNQHRGIFQQRSCNGDTLLLAAGDTQTPFAHHSAVAVGQPGNKVVGLGVGCRGDHEFVVDLGIAVGNIGFHGVGEQEHILEHEGEEISQILQTVISDIVAVDGDGAAAQVQDTDQALEQHTLAAARTAHDAQLLAVGQIHRNAVQNHFAVKAQISVLDLDVGLVGDKSVVTAVGDTGLLLQEVLHFGAGHHLLLHLEQGVVDLGDIVHDLHDIGGAGGDITHQHIAPQNQYCADGDGADIGELLDGIKQHIELGGQPNLADVGFPDLVVGNIELGLLNILVGEGTDQTDSLDVFLDRQIHLGMAFPDLPEVGPGLFAEIHQRRAQRHHQRQGNEDEPDVHGGQQVDGNDHHKNAVEDAGHDPAEHFLEHGGVAA